MAFWVVVCEDVGKECEGAAACWGDSMVCSDAVQGALEWWVGWGSVGFVDGSTACFLVFADDCLLLESGAGF